ncbi:MAG TPA: anti-sigma factor [Acidimicrobiia bacterium]
MSDDRGRAPTDEDLAVERLIVEELAATAGSPLDEASLWEPMPDLEDAIMGSIRAEAARRDDVRPAVRSYRRLVAVAAALVVLAATAGVVFAMRSDPADWTVALGATALAPGASGTIEGWNEPSGTRMRLDLEGLPEAPAGHFYELWLSADDLHVSAGTFHAGEGVELWAAVPRSDFPRLWITLEAVDDDESPSDETLLDTDRA